MLLKSLKYAAILCEPVRTKTLVYNPFLIGEVQSARRLLDQHRGTVRTAEGVISSSQSSIANDDLVGHQAEWRESLEGITMTPVLLPKFSAPQDYDAFVKRHFLLLTELFSPIWERTLGGARNLLIGGVQMKGCGLTLPVPSYNFINGSGVYGLAMALKAFIYAGLMDSSLPLGSNRAIAVQWAPWGSDVNPLGIYLRELRLPRMIQVGPELSQEDLQNIREEIRSQSGTDSAREFLEIFTAQLAAMVSLGGRSNFSPDNVLINGQFIDEETWYWPKDLRSIRLSFEFEGDEMVADWKESTFSSSTFLLLRNSIHHVHKYSRFLYPPESVPSVSEIEDMFFSSLGKVLPGENLRPVWGKGLELSQKFHPGAFQVWLRELESAGWSFEVEHFKNNCFGLNLMKPRSESPSLGIAQDFNSQPRTDFWKVAIKLSKLSPSETDPDEVTNSLQRLIGTSGFVLPKRFLRGKGMVENRFELEEFMALTYEKWPQLKKLSVDLTVWDGKGELVLPQFSPATRLSGDCIPLYFTVSLGQKTHILPALKTILTGKPG